jgi:hypothetical protein
VRSTYPHIFPDATCRHVNRHDFKHEAAALAELVLPSTFVFVIVSSMPVSRLSCIWVVSTVPMHVEYAHRVATNECCLLSGPRTWTNTSTQDLASSMACAWGGAWRRRTSTSSSTFPFAFRHEALAACSPPGPALPKPVRGVGLAPRARHRPGGRRSTPKGSPPEGAEALAN